MTGGYPTVDVQKLDSPAFPPVAVEKLDAAAWRIRGNGHAKLGTQAAYVEAVACYSSGLDVIACDTGLKTSRLRARLLSCRAHVRLLQKGDEAAEAAVQDCRLAILEDASDAKTYWRAGKASLRLGLAKEAAEFCRQGIEAAGANAELRELLSEVQKVDKDVDCTHSFQLQEGSADDFRSAAVKSFRESVKASPLDADAHCNLGVALSQQGQDEEAMSSFRAAVKIEPRHAGALRNLGESLQRMGDFVAAIRAYRNALSAAPDEATVDVQVGLGQSLGMVGELTGAASAFQAALEVEPGHPDALLGLGIASERLGKADDAMIAFRAAAKVSPRNAVVQYNLGLILERQARQKTLEERTALLLEAEAALWAATTWDPTNPDPHCELGVVLLEAGRVSAAKDAFKEALRLDPHHQGAWSNMESLKGLCEEACLAMLPPDAKAALQAKFKEEAESEQLAVTAADPVSVPEESDDALMSAAEVAPASAHIDVRDLEL